MHDPGQVPGLGLEPPPRPIIRALAVVQDFASPHAPVLTVHLDDPGDGARAEVASDPVPIARA